MASRTTDFHPSALTAEDHAAIAKTVREAVTEALAPLIAKMNAKKKPAEEAED